MGCGVLIDVNELVRQIEKASPNGVATLDSNTKVPKVQINGVLSAADVGAIASETDPTVQDFTKTLTSNNAVLMAVNASSGTISADRLPSSYQPLDSDLTTIAALEQSNRSVIFSDGISWTAKRISVTTDIVGVLPLANGGTGVSLTSANGITTFGFGALLNNLTGSNSSAFGLNAGRYVSSGFTSLTATQNNCYFGALTKGTEGATNEQVFGFNATGNGSNTVTIGDNSITNTYLKGVVSTDSTAVSTSTTTGAIRAASLGVTGAIFAGNLNSVGLVTAPGYIGTDTGMYRLDTNTYTKRFLSFNLYGSPSSSSGYRTQSDGWGLVLEQLATTGECRLRVSEAISAAGSINTLVNIFSYLPSNSTFSFGGVSIVAGTAALFMNSTKVISDRRTGWAAPTGTATRTTFATGSVTLPQLAERVKALIDDLTTHGLIGA